MFGGPKTGTLFLLAVTSLTKVAGKRRERRGLPSGENLMSDQSRSQALSPLPSLSLPGNDVEQRCEIFRFFR